MLPESLKSTEGSSAGVGGPGETLTARERSGGFLCNTNGSGLGVFLKDQMEFDSAFQFCWRLGFNSRASRPSYIKDTKGKKRTRKSRVWKERKEEAESPRRGAGAAPTAGFGGEGRPGSLSPVRHGAPALCSGRGGGGGSEGRDLTALSGKATRPGCVTPPWFSLSENLFCNEVPIRTISPG